MTETQVTIIPYPEPEHLGDGAYVSCTSWGSLQVTANHHDPRMATDVVEIEPRSFNRLRRYLDNIEGIEHD